MKSTKPDPFVDKISGKKVLVIGLGMQGGGMGVVRFLSSHGAAVSVYDDKNRADLQRSLDALSDLKNTTFTFQGEWKIDLSTIDFVIKGPSVKWSHPLVVEAVRMGIDVSVETALLVKYSPCLVIGVTGTRGKSTTSNMIYKALGDIYTRGKVYMAGNFPGTCALALLDVLTPDDIVVLELSSWQLSGFHKEQISPNIAVFTNIFEDHLNTYSKMSDYVYDKTAIYAYQKKDDMLIISSEFLELVKAVSPFANTKIQLSKREDFRSDLVNLKGEHSYENAAMAKAAALTVLGDSYESAVEKSISEVRALSCRQEILGSIGKITFINDSASTTPISLIKALHTFDDKRVVLIVGGNSKQLDTHELSMVLKLKRENILKIFLLQGTFTEELIANHVIPQEIAISGPGISFAEVVQEAYKEAKNTPFESYVLFSPGATSFAQFRNEFHRGEEFARIVSDIMDK